MVAAATRLHAEWQLWRQRWAAHLIQWCWKVVRRRYAAWTQAARVLWGQPTAGRAWAAEAAEEAADRVPALILTAPVVPARSAGKCCEIRVLVKSGSKLFDSAPDLLIV